MSVDFGKIFGFALRYPLRKDVFFLLFTVNLIFGLLSWFVTGYLIGDAVGLEGAAALTQLISSFIYLAPITIVSFIVTIFLIPLYFHNSMEFYKGKRKPIFDSLGVAKERFFPFLLTLIIMMLILLACFGSIILFSIIKIPSTMIVGDFDLVDVTVLPDRAYSPLVVDPYTVLALTIPLEFLQAVSWRYSKVTDQFRYIQEHKLSAGNPLQVNR